VNARQTTVVGSHMGVFWSSSRSGRIISVATFPQVEE
jgi:hypothetical protein